MTMCTIQCLIKSLQSKSLQLSQNWPYTTYVFVFIYFCVFWRHCWFFPQLLLPCVVAMGFEKDWLYAPMQPPTQWHRLIQVTQFSSVQLLSHVWLFATPCMDCSMPGFPVHHQLLEFTQTHVHWVSDAIKPSHPLLSSSPLAFNLSQHQGLFKWVSSSHQVAKVLELQLQHQSSQWILRTDFL